MNRATSNGSMRVFVFVCVSVFVCLFVYALTEISHLKYSAFLHNEDQPKLRADYLQNKDKNKHERNDTKMIKKKKRKKKEERMEVPFRNIVAKYSPKSSSTKALREDAH